MLNSLKKEHDGCSIDETFVNKEGKQVILQRCKFSELQAGLNIGKLLRGKVVCHVYYTDSPAL